MDKLGSSEIVKIGIVVDDIEKAAEKFREIFPLDQELTVRRPNPDQAVQEGRYQNFRGQPVRAKLKSLLVPLEPVYLEVLEPCGDDPSPWKEFLDKNGPGVCFISFYIDGFEQTLQFRENHQMPPVFIEEKGFERYAYFDTLAELGVTLEVKERKQR